MQIHNTNTNENITIKCYGVVETWNDRNKAMKYYLECMKNSEGSEKQRYTNIFVQLAEGENNCIDLD